MVKLTTGVNIGDALGTTPSSMGQAEGETSPSLEEGIEPTNEGQAVKRGTGSKHTGVILAVMARSQQLSSHCEQIFVAGGPGILAFGTVIVAHDNCPRHCKHLPWFF